QIEAQNCGDLPALVEAAQRLSADVTRLEACFAGGGGRQPLARFRADGAAELPIEQLGQSLDELYALLRPLEERNAEIAAVLERTLGLREHWQHILEAPADDDASTEVPTEVRWVEPLLRGGSFHA